jgi:hypothetical protein
MAQETWEDISNKLSSQHGIKVSLQGVQAFFKRANNRNRRRPLGFDSKRPISIASPAVADTPENQDSIYDEARRAIREAQQSRPKIIKPDRPL